MYLFIFFDIIKVINYYYGWIRENIVSEFLENYKNIKYLI